MARSRQVSLTLSCEDGFPTSPSQVGVRRKAHIDPHYLSLRTAELSTLNFHFDEPVSRILALATAEPISVFGSHCSSSQSYLSDRVLR